MSGAMLIEAWSDTLLTTALLVIAVLLVRKPFARHFGPRLTYGLWAIPALRLVLPPLPLADPVAVPVAVQVDAPPVLALPVDAAGMAQASAPAWTLADILPWLVLPWAAGMIAVIGAAVLAHRRFRATVLRGAVELEPIGSIRLVMTDAVDGPVAFGLSHRVVAVPQDFFARYAAEERALAVDHELSHHRYGDLWANAAALVLLASQWFNPFAWRAIRAFQFDQEAACDARVLTMADDSGRRDRAASYATAIVKAAVGPRLSLAAPMAVHDNLQERLTMLTKQDISKRRGLVGRLLIGGTALAVLGATATLVPSGIAAATAQTSDVPAPPAAPDAPPPPEAPPSPEAMLFSDHDENVTETVTTSEDGKTREVRRIVIRHDHDRDGKAADAPADHKKKAQRFEIRVPGSLSREDVLATLKEQGITGERAEAIADKLEAKREERLRVALAPMPPMPPMPPIPPMPPMSWSTNGKAMVIGKCGDGAKAAPIVDIKESDGGKRNQVYMSYCGANTPEARAARLSALKKAREAFVEGERARHLSETMRAKVAADLDKAIAEIEKSGE